MHQQQSIRINIKSKLFITKWVRLVDSAVISFTQNRGDYFKLAWKIQIEFLYKLAATRRTHTNTQHLQTSSVTVPVNAMQLNDIWMISKCSQKHYFPKRALSICFISKSIEYFLNGNDLLSFPINRFPNNSISPFAETLKNEREIIIRFWTLLLKICGGKFTQILQLTLLHTHTHIHIHTHTPTHTHTQQRPSAFKEPSLPNKSNKFSCFDWTKGTQQINAWLRGSCPQATGKLSPSKNNNTKRLMNCQSRKWR